MDRGDACQIYHLNLLKRWNEGTSVGLAAVVSNEDDLGPEAALKNHPFALVSEGDHLSPRQLRCSQRAREPPPKKRESHRRRRAVFTFC